MQGSLVTRRGPRGTAYYVVLRGKWHRCPGDTKRAAQIYQAQLVAALTSGETISDERVSVATFASRWLESREAEVSPGTVAAYRQVLRTMILPAFGGRLLAAVSAEDLALWRDDIGRRYAPRTTAVAIAAVCALFQRAVAWRVLRYSPAEGLRPPRVEEGPVRALTASQVGDLLSACLTPLERVLVLLGVTGGLRAGEVVATRWEHLDVQARTYYVAGTWSDARAAVGPTKTPGSTAHVMLSPACIAALEEHRAVQRRQHGDVEWMVTGPRGGRLHLRVLHYMFRALAVRAGLPHVSYHWLRHTCASLLIDQGAHVKLVQTQLRHASVSMTLDVYGHLYPARQDGAVAALDRLILR